MIFCNISYFIDTFNSLITDNMYKKNIIFLYFFVGSTFLYLSAGAQNLSSKELIDLRVSYMASCFNKQRPETSYSIASDKQIRSYCVCLAEQVFPDNTTVQDMAIATKILNREGGTAMAKYMLKGRDMNEVGIFCAKQSRN
jgi:hypothetical protein